jgi:DNA-binding NtrC family response regulator
MGKKIRRIAHRDMELLKSYTWPGNIRELRNVIEHALIISNSETLELQRLSNAKSQHMTITTLEEMERQHIQTTVNATNGRIKGSGGAAELLGLHPSTLYSRMRKLEIKPNPN